MKIFSKTLFILFLTTLHVNAQDTTYYDTDRARVTDLTEAHYYVIVNEESKVTRSYFMDGSIKSERTYFSEEKKVVHGERKEWYENGQLRWNARYRINELDGEILGYWENGALKRKDLYERGKLIESGLWDQDGQEIEHYPFEVKAEYKGGRRAISRFLSGNLVYPERDLQAGIEGKVMLEFKVKKDGSMSDIRITQSATTGMDEEALRVVTLMKDLNHWTPGMLDGEYITTLFSLPISFALQD